MVERYTRKVMGDIWSPSARFENMMQVEVAVALAQGEIGLIPKDAARKIKEKAKFEYERILEIEKSDQTKTESLLLLNNKVKELDGVIDDIATEELEAFDSNIKEIIDTLSDHDIVVEKPHSNSKKKGKNSSNRRHTDDDRRTDSSRRTPRSNTQTPRKDLTFEEDDLDLIGQMRRRP